MAKRKETRVDMVAGKPTLQDDPQDKRVSVEDASPSKKDPYAELAAWVLGRVDDWKQHRKSNYERRWDEYERVWRGLWMPEDKNRKTERSTLVTPALGEAVENIVAEVEEAVFGRGDFFDLKGEITDPEEEKRVVEQNKALLREDLELTDFHPNVGEALINGAVYGNGIGEIIVKEMKKREISASVETMVPGIPPEMQVVVTTVQYSCLRSVNPRNFVIDPTARTIDDALGCAIEEYVPSYQIAEGQESGAYRKVKIDTDSGELQLTVDPQVENEYSKDKTHTIRYYGKVPAKLLPKEEQQPADSDPLGEAIAEIVHKAEDEAEQALRNIEEPIGDKDSTEPIDGGMVEAIVVLVNRGTICIKGKRTPYLMEDRPVVAFPWDIVPGRFWGRSVCEKGLTPQKILDAEMRARIDALAYISAPLMGLDASRLPRGFNLKVYPGKSILTNGDPNTILRPMHFGQLDQSTWQQSQQLDQMVQRATGSLDVLTMAQRGAGDARPGAVSMMLSGIVKRHKRTMSNFMNRFMVPAIRKIMWRNMQYYPERYTPFNWSFVASGTMGIMQREYETANLMQLLNTMEPQSREYKMILMGVVENTGLTNRSGIVDMLRQSIQASIQMEQAQAQMAQTQAQDPALQAAQMQLQQTMIQLQIAETQAKIRELNARATLQEAKTQNEVLEPQFKQLEVATKGIYQVAQDQQQREFDRRIAIADRVLKEKDIESNERIARMQSGASVAAEAVKGRAAAAIEQTRAASNVGREAVKGRATVAAARTKALEPKPLVAGGKATLV